MSQPGVTQALQYDPISVITTEEDHTARGIERGRYRSCFVAHHPHFVEIRKIFLY